jgi:hypothetical protein
MGSFPTWDCDVFCPGYILYPIGIQLEAGKWARPLFCGLGITLDSLVWDPLDEVIKRFSVLILLDCMVR